MGQDLVLPASVAERLARALETFDRHAALTSLPDPDARRDPRAARYHRAARAESTRRAYMRYLGIYLDFCDRTNRRDLPANAATMEAFAIFLANRAVDRGKNKGAAGMAPNSIRLALSAVRSYHRLQGENPPDLGLAGGIVEGYARERSQDPMCTDGQGVPGLRLPTLRQMFEVCDPSTNAGSRDRALLSLGWALMARRSELAGLDIVHVREVSEGMEVLVRRSKTDQLGVGKTVAIPWKSKLGALCPVTCTLAWKDRLERVHGVTDGGLLRGVDRHDHINGVGAWAGANSTRLDPMTVELVIARAATRAMIPDAAKFRGHSLRRGGATDAYAAGADILSIARHGRWGERSPVIFRYIEDVDRWKRNALAGVGEEDA